MSVTCSDILNFADSCLLNKTEVSDRAAISRAYYSSYHNVYPILENGPNDSHQGLINYLQNDAVKCGEPYNYKDLRALSFMLANMKGLRKIADYYLSEPIKRIDAEVTVKTAGRVLEKVSEMTAAKKAQKQ